MASTETKASQHRALWRGFTMRCPNCGERSLFGRFLKVVDACPACGEEYSHHRADDFPAYLVIVIVGHIVVPGVLLVEELYAPPSWVHYVIWLPLIVLLGLALLQPIKGFIVALQWQFGMHGFDQSRGRRTFAIPASGTRGI